MPGKAFPTLDHPPGDGKEMTFPTVVAPRCKSKTVGPIPSTHHSSGSKTMGHWSKATD